MKVLAPKETRINIMKPKSIILRDRFHIFLSFFFLRDRLSADGTGEEDGVAVTDAEEEFEDPDDVLDDDAIDGANFGSILRLTLSAIFD